MRFIVGVVAGAAAVGWLWSRAARRERRGRELDAQVWVREREQARQRIGAAAPVASAGPDAARRIRGSIHMHGDAQSSHDLALAAAQEQLENLSRDGGRHRRG